MPCCFAAPYVQSPTTTWDSDCSTRFSSQFEIHPPSCFWTTSRTFESDFKEDALVISLPGFSVVFMLSDEMPDLNLDKTRREQFGVLKQSPRLATLVLPSVAPRGAMFREVDDAIRPQGLRHSISSV